MVFRVGRMDHEETRYRNPIVGEEYILGYTDRETVKLDLDDVDYYRVKSVARWLCRRFNLGGFIILRSSENNYHVVFNGTVTWEENIKIVGYASWMLANYFTNHKLMGWAIMQMIKGSSTLRISTKFKKPRPRIIYKEGKQANEIKKFREYRKIFGKLQ